MCQCVCVCVCVWTITCEPTCDLDIWNADLCMNILHSYKCVCMHVCTITLTLEILLQSSVTVLIDIVLGCSL